MKKLVSSLLALSMMCTVSAQVFAETPENDMEKALATVESRITVPTDYDAFLSNSYTDENGIEYTFSWENGENEKSINITVNESGIISNYQYRDNEYWENQKQFVGITLPNTLYYTACDYVKRLNPDIYANLKITADANNECGGAGSYSFEIQRYENNIPVEGNCGYIEISADGKTLKDFFLTYTNGVNFEKPNRIISRNTAKKAYTNKIGFSLCYGSKFNDNGIIAAPMYTINGENMNYISAANGRKIKLNDITYVHDESTEDLQGDLPCEYTMPQINELKGIKGVMNEKRAEKIVRNNKIFNIPQNYTLKNISGTKNDGGNNKYLYTLLFVGAKKSDFVEVMIDAESGEVLNFRRTQNNGKNTITNEKAKNIAENAVAYLAPKHINDYILDESTQDGVFTFIRNVNGIEFAINQIDIYVDMTNGNIVWYDYSYSDIKFPSLENIIPKEKISNIFFEQFNFSPVYVLNCSKQGMTKYDRATLVYKFSSSDITDIDAFTGKIMWDN